MLASLSLSSLEEIVGKTRGVGGGGGGGATRQPPRVDRVKLNNFHSNGPKCFKSNHRQPKPCFCHSELIYIYKTLYGSYRVIRIFIGGTDL